tara:strand:+ start:246 stop:362 length:117 start_codon:yes stop_codon:yes gene_type:complete
MSKGSSRRPENTDKFQENFDKIFRNSDGTIKEKKDEKD